MREQPRFLWGWASPSHPGLGARTVMRLLLAGSLLFLGHQTWWVLTHAAAVRSGARVVEIPAHRGFLGVARIRNCNRGEYQVLQGANTAAVLTMREGGPVLQHSAVFREGATVAELAGA